MGSSDVLLQVTGLGLGGTERYVQDLAAGYAQRGLRVTVVVDAPPLEREQALLDAGVRVVVLSRKPLEGTRYREALTHAIRASGARIVHANAWSNRFHVVAASAHAGVPLVMTHHHTDRAPAMRDLLGVNRTPFIYYRERLWYRRFRWGVISISPQSLNGLRKRWGSRVNAALVRNGVEIPVRERVTPPESGVPTILWLGSMTDRKRPFLAIDVAAALNRSGRRFRLVMLGGGELLERARCYARSAGVDNVELPGPVGDVREHLRRASVLLHTATREGVPYAVLEAMSYGLPVVATDCGAMQDAVVHTKTGLLAPVDSLPELTAHLESLLESDALRREMGSAGYERARQGFSLERMIDGTLAAYCALAGVRVLQPECRGATHGGYPFES